PLAEVGSSLRSVQAPPEFDDVLYPVNLLETTALEPESLKPDTILLPAPRTIDVSLCVFDAVRSTPGLFSRTLVKELVSGLPSTNGKNDIFSGFCRRAASKSKGFITPSIFFSPAII